MNTVQEFRDKKRELEENMKQLLRDFESETGLVTTYIYLTRSQTGSGRTQLYSLDIEVKLE